MAGPNGLHDATWDTASSGSLRAGSTKVAITKYSPPKLDIKVEKVRRVGAMLADKRTPGAGEISDGTIEMLASDYEAQILPRIGNHAGTEIEFTLTMTLSHPSVIGQLSILCDHVRIIGTEFPEMDGSEKPAMVKLTLSVLDIWSKGRGGKWQTLVRKSTMTSADARAQMAF